MTTADLAARASLAVDVAREAGALLVSWQQRRLTVTTKTSATDPVSEADHASEALIMARIDAAFPSDGLLGEEATTNRETTSGLRWVVDPLDGTVNYLYGLPAWCVSIACQDVETGATVLGVVHHPGARETFAAVAGGGAWLLAGDDDLGSDEAIALHASRPESPAMALVATGYAYEADVRAAQARRISALAGEVRDIRRIGAAALDLAWTAAGRLDAYGEHGLQPWDWMAGLLLVSEAGGVTMQVDHELAGKVRRGTFAGDARTVALLLDHFDREDGT